VHVGSDFANAAASGIDIARGGATLRSSPSMYHPRSKTLKAHKYWRRAGVKWWGMTTTSGILTALAMGGDGEGAGVAPVPTGDSSGDLSAAVPTGRGVGEGLLAAGGGEGIGCFGLAGAAVSVNGTVESGAEWCSLEGGEGCAWNGNDGARAPAGDVAGRSSAGLSGSSGKSTLTAGASGDVGAAGRVNAYTDTPEMSMPRTQTATVRLAVIMAPKGTRADVYGEVK